MNQLLATLTLLSAFGLLAFHVISTTPFPSRTTGVVMSFTSVPDRIRETGVTSLQEGSVLRRGDRVRTTNGFAALRYDHLIITLSTNTEVQLIDPTHIRLIGGRVFVHGDTTIETPWISSRSPSQSVINYAWKQEVQILPMGATSTVENQRLTSTELGTPAIWSEATKELSISEKPFDITTSSEANYYTWSQSLLQL